MLESPARHLVKRSSLNETVLRESSADKSFCDVSRRCRALLRRLLSLHAPLVFSASYRCSVSDWLRLSLFRWYCRHAGRFETCTPRFKGSKDIIGGNPRNCDEHGKSARPWNRSIPHAIHMKANAPSRRPTPAANFQNPSRPWVRSNMKLPGNFLYVDIFVLNVSLRRSAEPYMERNHHLSTATRVRLFSVKHSS